MKEAPPKFRLDELASRFSLELRGNGAHEISGIGTLEHAGPTDASFYVNRAYRNSLKNTAAGAVILTARDAEECPGNCLVGENPHAAFARLAALFDPRIHRPPGIHPSAVVDPSAEIGEQVHIGPLVVVEAGARIGSGCTIQAGCFIGARTHIGEGGLLYANVCLAEGVRIGNRVIIHSGAVIGADGFGLAFSSDHWEKVPQLGSVRIGDDCEIGANTTIDRGAIEDTVLEDDVRLDNLVQIAHNVTVGAHTAIAACSAIAGSATVGKNCLFGGQVGILGHLAIADGVTIGARSGIGRDISDPGTVWAAALPAMPVREWQRNLAHIRKLDGIVDRIRLLEKQASGKNENNG